MERGRVRDIAAKETKEGKVVIWNLIKIKHIYVYEMNGELLIGF